MTWMDLTGSDVTIMWQICTDLNCVRYDCPVRTTVPPCIWSPSVPICNWNSLLWTFYCPNRTSLPICSDMRGFTVQYVTTKVWTSNTCSNPGLTHTIILYVGSLHHFFHTFQSNDHRLALIWPLALVCGFEGIKCSTSISIGKTSQHLNRSIRDVNVSATQYKEIFNLIYLRP